MLASRAARMSSSTTACFLSLAALAVALGCSAGPEPTSPLRDYNVVLINVDTLRADRLGCYGHDRDTSPFLDSLAADGILFERAYSTSSYTRPSVASLLSGRLPTARNKRPRPNGKLTRTAIPRSAARGRMRSATFRLSRA